MISPFSKMPPPEPSDWGKQMTVCISALAEMNTLLFHACDSKISTGDTSGDRVADKQYPVHLKWHAMFSGDDIAFVEPIISEVIVRIADNPMLALTQEGVAWAFTTSYQNIRRKYAHDRILSVYDLSMEEFLKSGAKMFRGAYLDMKREIDEIDLGCEFLVSGFNQDGVGKIFTVSNPGISRDRSLVGYWAIGSGAYRTQRTTLPLH
jgi:hypothetical protein